MPTRRKKKTKKSIKTYTHEDRKRKNNPPVGLVSSTTDPIDHKTEYQHDPHIDPYLNWAGKREGTEIEVRNVSLHIHERIDPQRVVKAFLKKDTGPKQISLFERPDNVPPLHKAIDFYKHEQDWTNRLIAGDSLLVMNSLLKKEGMANKAQMVYIDPPYGIKYNSNFQPFTNKRDVKDRDKDIPAEPEMIQAFRDTWELGIHSYLTHLRDRLLLNKELLHESGSCFVQISDENLHHVKEIMDEVFDRENFISLIYFATTSGFSTSTISRVGDYLIWFAKDKSRLKYRQLFLPKENLETGDAAFKYVELKNGTRRVMTKDERDGKIDLPNGSRIYRLGDLQSQGGASDDTPFEFDGETFRPNEGSHWKANYPAGMNRLKNANRIQKHGQRIHYVRYVKDYPVKPLTNSWMDTGFAGFATDKRYVVETNPKVIQRCILMTSDPGDLVFDPTCGSGTTAYVAEQWGRRWITCDTSRVAITLAKQRLMTTKFDYYQLAHPEEGVRSGFEYKQAPHIKLEHIAKNEPPKEEKLYDKPEVETSKVRVTGPFTSEAVPSLRIRPIDGNEPKIQGSNRELSQTGETGNQAMWRDELRSTGIRAIGGKIISFSRIEPMLATRYLHAKGEMIEKDGTNNMAVISFGPDFGPIEQRQVEEAIKEAMSLKEKPDFVVFAAFHFDPEAAKDIDQIEWKGVKILKAQMSVDLLTKDLRKKRSSNQSYWLIGQPDVEVSKDKNDNYKVKVLGFDYYDPVSGQIISKGSKHIAMWFLDSDYDERSLFVDQIFFPEKNKKRDWTRLAKALKRDVDEELLEAFSGVESLQFKAGKERKIAVKIIDNRGIESLVIKNLD